jgi:hypothetical protein
MENVMGLLDRLKEQAAGLVDQAKDPGQRSHRRRH